MESAVINIWPHAEESRTTLVLNDPNIHDVVFLCYQEHEPWNGFTKDNEKLTSFFESLEKGKKHLSIITGAAPENSSYFDKHPLYPTHSTDVYTLSTFFFHAAYRNLNKHDRFGVRRPRIVDPPLFCSLNNQPHYHRCFMMDYLYEQNLLNLGAVTWHYPERTGTDDRGIPYKFRFWKPEHRYLDSYFIELRDSYISIPSQFYTCLVNLIAEATVKVPFITEKTTMALFLERPFLVYGARGFYKHLTSLGFQLYDEIFNYKFDDIENDKVRGAWVVDNLKNLRGVDPYSIYEAIGLKLKYNRELAIDIGTHFVDYIPKNIPDHISAIILKEIGK